MSKKNKGRKITILDEASMYFRLFHGLDKDAKLLIWPEELLRWCGVMEKSTTVVRQYAG